MKKISILLLLIVCITACGKDDVKKSSQVDTVTEIKGKQLYEHHDDEVCCPNETGKQSAYNFIAHDYINGVEPLGNNPNRDMLEHNGLETTTTAFGFTSGASSIWGGLHGGNGTTKYVKVSNFNYDNATKTSIKNAYDQGSSSTTVNSVQNGDLYVAKIRNMEYYVVLKITGVNTTTKNDFTFDYKYSAR